jgi:NADPH:quinone reductase-like Zn-dependent oxidoreductase
MGGLKKRESVLIHNAGGGVGLAALDIALHLEATTYGTSSAGKHLFLKERGLNHPIDYRNQDFLASIMSLTDGKGVEMVIDPIGGNNWKKSYKALRSTGRLGMFGVSTVADSTMVRFFQFIKLIAQMPWYSPLGLMNANKSVFGVNLGHMWGERNKISGWMQTILKGVDEGWVRPHVDRTFPIEQAGEAHAYIEARKNIGKIVLVTGD